MPRVKLASQTLRTGRSGQAGQISPTLLTGSLSTSAPSPGSIRAPSVNINAGTVQFTPVTPPEITVDNTLAAASDLASVWVESAYKYKKRENKVLADEALLRVNDAFRDGFYGGVDSDGNSFDGYMHVEGARAGTAYEGYVRSLDKDIERILSEYGPEVRQQALLRIADIRDTYKTRAANHRAKQLEVAEANQVALGLDNLLREVDKDPNYLLKKDPITGVTKLDDFASRNSDTFLEKQALKQSLLSGAFNAVRFDDTKDPVQRYEDSLNWYKAHEEVLPPDTKYDVESKLQTMKTSADAYIEEQKTEARKVMQNNLEAAGGEVFHIIAQSGEYSYQGLEGLLASIRDAYADNPAKAEEEILRHMKTGFETLALEEGIGVARTEAVKMMEWAQKNGVQLFQDQEEANDFIIFLGEDGELQKTMESVNGAVSDKTDSIAKSALGVRYVDEVIPGIEESGKIYLHEGQVYEDFPDLRPMQGDSEAVLDEKRKLAGEAVTLSQNANKATPVGGLQAAVSKLQSLHNNGIMFRDEGDFQQFLSENGIFDSESRAVLKAKRKELQTVEGERLNTFTEGLKEEIILTFHPERGMIFDSTTGTLRVASTAELMKLTDMTPLERNWLNQIDAIANDFTLAPRERAQKMQDFLRLEVINKAEKLAGMRQENEVPLDFSDALSLIHNHLQVSRLINYNEYEGVMVALETRANSVVPSSTEPIRVNPGTGTTEINLGSGYNALIDSIDPSALE